MLSPIPDILKIDRETTTRLKGAIFSSLLIMGLHILLLHYKLFGIRRKVWLVQVLFWFMLECIVLFGERCWNKISCISVAVFVICLWLSLRKVWGSSMIKNLRCFLQIWTLIYAVCKIYQEMSFYLGRKFVLVSFLMFLQLHHVLMRILAMDGADTWKLLTDIYRVLWGAQLKEQFHHLK